MSGNARNCPTHPIVPGTLGFHGMSIGVPWDVHLCHLYIHVCLGWERQWDRHVSIGGIDGSELNLQYQKVLSVLR